jgi:hypothetical protein
VAFGLRRLFLYVLRNSWRNEKAPARACVVWPSGHDQNIYMVMEDMARSGR